MKNVDISKKLRYSHCAVKRFVAASEHTLFFSDKGTTVSKISARQIHQMRREDAKMQLPNGKKIFKAAEVLQTSSCGIPQKATLLRKPPHRQPLKTMFISRGGCSGHRNT